MPFQPEVEMVGPREMLLDDEYPFRRTALLHGDVAIFRLSRLRAIPKRPFLSEETSARASPFSCYR